MAREESRLTDSSEPLAYDLRLEADPNQDTFAATVHISIRVKRLACVIELHARDLVISSAIWEDAQGARTKLRVMVDPDHERVLFEGPGAFLPQTGRLTIVYKGALGADKSGLYRVQLKDEAYLFSQMEPVSARRVFPSFDEPGFKVPMTLSVVTPEALTVVSNEEPLGAQTQGDGKKLTVFRPTSPLPTYLLALAIGPFETRSRLLAKNAHRPLPLKVRALAPKGHEAGLEQALDRVEVLLPAMEHYFAGAYPFSKLDLVAAPEFAANGMENAGAIFMREWLLTLDPKLTTAEQQADQISVLAHELGHQWFGNLVTMPWWDDLWLNEGFATWFGYKIAQEAFPKRHFEMMSLMGNHAAMVSDMLQNTRRIRQPCRDANDIYSAFDAITYRKGAALLGMMEYQIGPERFMRGIRAYVNRYAGATATSADFLRVMGEQALGFELVESLRDFLDRPGVPEITFRLTCDANAQVLHLSQKRYAQLGALKSPEPAWQVPLCWRLVYPGEASAKGQAQSETCALFSAVEGEMRLPKQRGCPLAVVPNADGVGYYIAHLPKPEFASLFEQALRPAEKGSLMHDVEAGLFSGKLSFFDAYSRTQLAFSDPAWPALGPVFRVWRLALDELGQKSRRALQEGPWLKPHRALFAKLVFDTQRAERAHIVGPARAQLARFVWREMNDRATRVRLVREGNVALRTGKISTALSREVAPIAIAAAVEAEPRKNFAKAWGWVADEKSSGDVRAACLKGLSQVTHPDAQDALMRLLADPKLSSADLLALLSGQFEEGTGRARFWDLYVKEAPLLFKRLSGWERRNLIALSGWMTTEKQAEEAKGVLGPLAEETTGGAQALSHAVEAISVRARVLATLR